MDIINKILAPTDLSPFSANGVRYACNLAKRLQAQVIIAHVFNAAPILSAARSLGVVSGRTETDNLLVRILERYKQRLQRFVDQHLSDLKADLDMEQVVEMGEPHTILVKWAKQKGIDVIVMSAHGHSRLPRMLMGSVTEKVLRSSPCPVLAIPSGDE